MYKILLISAFLHHWNHQPRRAAILATFTLLLQYFLHFGVNKNVHTSPLQ